MKKPKVWSTLSADGSQTNVVVLKDGVFYGGQIAPNKVNAFIGEIIAGTDPVELLGEKCEQAEMAEITRVTANSVGDLKIESDDKTVLKLPMFKQGFEIIEAIEKVKGQTWVVEIERKTRFGSALIALAIGFAMGGGMVWAYFGVVSGEINRIHWLAAFLINTFGPVSLLVLGALIFIGAMCAFGYYLANPAEVWTLEEDSGT